MKKIIAISVTIIIVCLLTAGTAESTTFFDILNSKTNGSFYSLIGFSSIIRVENDEFKELRNDFTIDNNRLIFQVQKLEMLDTSKTYYAVCLKRDDKYYYIEQQEIGKVIRVLNLIRDFMKRDGWNFFTKYKYISTNGIVFANSTQTFYIEFSTDDIVRYNNIKDVEDMIYYLENVDNIIMTCNEVLKLDNQS